MKVVVLVALEQELKINDVKANIYYTKVGKTNAAITATEVILLTKPGFIINYGTAGAVKPNLSGLLTVGSVCQRDADCGELAPRGFLLDDNDFYLYSKEGDIKCGSGDNFVTTVDDWTQKYCDIVDMELWGIAKACKYYGVPWISKKFVSDYANEDSAKDWQTTISNGREAFIDWFEKFNQTV